PPARRITTMVGELWLAIVRLIRVLRDQVRSAQGRLAAAEAVIAAVPDPLILLDDRRRVVRAHAPAASFVGLGGAPRPPPPRRVRRGAQPPRPHPAEARRADARPLYRQCEPRAAHTTDHAHRLHRDPARAGARGC